MTISWKNFSLQYSQRQNQVDTTRSNVVTTSFMDWKWNLKLLQVMSRRNDNVIKLYFLRIEDVVTTSGSIIMLNSLCVPSGRRPKDIVFTSSTSKRHLNPASFGCEGTFKYSIETFDIPIMAFVGILYIQKFNQIKGTVRKSWVTLEELDMKPWWWYMSVFWKFKVG